METMRGDTYADKPAQYAASEASEDQLLLSKSITTLLPETKLSDRGSDSKTDGTAPLTKVGSEKSIFSSIRERLDPLTSMLQERIEGTKEIFFDRKLRKSESVAEASEISSDQRTADVLTPKDVTTLVTTGDADVVIFGRSSSVDIKDGADEMAASHFRKSTSVDSFPNRKCQFFGESDMALLSSTDEDPMSDDASHDSPHSDNADQCSSRGDDHRISTHTICTQRCLFDSCDYTGNDLDVTSLPLLQSLTVLLWTKTRSFVISHKMKLLVGVVFSALWLLLPFPSFISGLILGVLLASGVAWLLQWLGISSMPHVCELPSTVKDVSFTSVVKPTMQPKELHGLDVFEGWMNETSLYEPNNFHISKTRSVYVTITNSILRLGTPKYNLHRRATWQERFPNPDFIMQREFSLVNSKVLLVPNGLVHKRLWCKKYPICVVAYPVETSELSDEVDHGVDVLKAFDSICIATSSKLSDNLKDSSIDPDIESVFADEETLLERKPKMVELFLFARANREKEEWYRRFVAATRVEPQLDEIERLPVTADVKSFDTKSLDKSLDTKSLDTKSLDTKSLDTKSLDTRSFDTKSFDTKSHSSKSTDDVEKRQRTSSSDSNSDVPDVAVIECLSKSVDMMPSNYLQYMSRVVPLEETLPAEIRTECGTPSSGSPLHGEATPISDLDIVTPSPGICQPEMLWVNALLSRFFFDFLHEQCWAEKMKEKLQAMLSKIHVPQFMDQLTITEIDLGDRIPSIGHSSAPYLNDRGLWIELDISYEGGFSITMETKCNLIKVTQTKLEALADSPLHDKRSPVTHSDEEDSAESSTDEELQDDSNDTVDDRRNVSSVTSKRLLRLVDKITQSRYFQHAADYKYIKKAIREVSNTPLVLIVELNHLSGTLALNVPPPPTDRLWAPSNLGTNLVSSQFPFDIQYLGSVTACQAFISFTWYGFQGNPTLQLSVKPRVGDRFVNVAHITEWIEKKLELEFQRIYVIPNMDDLIIPLMCDHITGDT